MNVFQFIGILSRPASAHQSFFSCFGFWLLNVNTDIWFEARPLCDPNNIVEFSSPNTWNNIFDCKGKKASQTNYIKCTESYINDWLQAEWLFCTICLILKLFLLAHIIFTITFSYVVSSFSIIYNMRYIVRLGKYVYCKYSIAKVWWGLGYKTKGREQVPGIGTGLWPNVLPTTLTSTPLVAHYFLKWQWTLALDVKHVRPYRSRWMKFLEVLGRKVIEVPTAWGRF